MSAPPTPSTRRDYDVSARSTDVFGRVLCSARDHHFIIDGPVQNGCPGEEVTPVEAFLSAVAACGVELIHVIAKTENRALDRVAVTVHGWSDRAKQSRTDVTTLNGVSLDFIIWGADAASVAALVESFKRR
jgi:uncharacterized OsmC-like protein